MRARHGNQSLTPSTSRVYLGWMKPYGFVDSSMSVSETTTMVFVIDDDDSVRRALARLMRSAGYNVEAFGSAEEFLSSERMSSDCLLVLDIRMPGMSGIQLRQYLKDAGAELTIIFITGYEDQRNGPCIAGADVVDFLYKPFDGQKLLDAIHAGLQRIAKLSNSGS